MCYNMIADNHTSPSKMERLQQALNASSRSRILSALPLVPRSANVAADNRKQSLKKRVRTSYEYKRGLLLKYKELYGNMLIPARFVVPADDSNWPQETWGYKLGRNVESIRAGRTHADMQEDLVNIGFVFEQTRTYNRTNYQFKRATLIRYKEIFGDMNVPRSFVVPSDDPRWSEEMWGFSLGQSVISLRCGDSHKSMRDDLLSIGFSFDVRKRGGKGMYKRYDQEIYVTEYALKRRMLLKYKELYGDMLVPVRFTVPSDDPNWPEEMWGRKLGKRIVPV